MTTMTTQDSGARSVASVKICREPGRRHVFSPKCGSSLDLPNPACEVGRLLQETSACMQREGKTLQVFVQTICRATSSNSYQRSPFEPLGVRFARPDRPPGVRFARPDRMTGRSRAVTLHHFPPMTWPDLCLRPIASNASCLVVGRSTVRDIGRIHLAWPSPGNVPGRSAQGGGDTEWPACWWLDSPGF